MRFKNVTWHNLQGRQALYDEVKLREKDSFRHTLTQNRTVTSTEYSRVEELYRYLELNYVREGDHKRVGDFHYGEMDMHRRASIWRDNPFYWHNLYWALSGYGERPLRALAWLFGLLVCLPLPMLFLGMQTAPGGQVLAGLDGYWQTLVFLLEKAA